MPQTRLAPWARQDRKGTVLSSRGHDPFELKRVFLERRLRTACVACHPLCPSMPCPGPALPWMFTGDPVSGIVLGTEGEAVNAVLETPALGELLLQ